MDKFTLLRELKDAVMRGVVTRSEVMSVFPTENTNMEQRVSAPHESVVKKVSHKFTLSNVLYGLGGLIVATGLIVLIATNWDSLNTSMRILVSLGAGIAFYLAGVLIFYSGISKAISEVLFGISLIVIPTGFGVLAYEWDFRPEFLNEAAWVLGASFLISLLSYPVFRQKVFAYFLTLHGAAFFISTVVDIKSNTEWLVAVAIPAIVLIGNYITYKKTNNGAALFFSVIPLATIYMTIMSWFVFNNPALSNETFYGYVFLVLGLLISFIGYYISGTSHIRQTGFWYLVGFSAFFGAAFSLSGFRPNQNVLWEVVLAGLITGAFFLSTHLKSRMVLLVSSIALIGYVIKITAEYFTSSFGWPISLVVIGLALIGIGYLSVYLNRKYIKQQV